MGASAGPDVIDTGLVLALDAADRNSYPGSGTTWTDLSGNGNNGTLVNGVGFDSANGGSLSFDGVDDYTDLNFANTSSLTLSFALKYNSNDIPYDNEHYPIISNASGGAQSSVQEHQKFNIRFNRSGSGRVFSMQFYQTDATTGAQGINIEGPSFEDSAYDSKWTFHTITLDDTSFKYYLNSNFYGENNNYDSTKLQTFNKFRVSRTTSFWGSTKMITSFIQIYNRALTAPEIQQNFNATRSRFGL